ncbi:MAG: type II toxin-antitoxin system RelE/ParE family toxin [Methylohalobius sp. ZOD2]
MPTIVANHDGRLFNECVRSHRRNPGGPSSRSSQSRIQDGIRNLTTTATAPDIGEKKKGDRAELRVYKFRSQKQLYLLGYSFDDGVRLIYLEAVGPHENFYRDLKR